MKDRFRTAIEESARTISSLTQQVDEIGAIVDTIIRSLQQGGQILTAGNGGSAAEALHMAEELVGRFRGNRKSLPGISLAADGTTLTCIANDYGFDEVFARQIEGLARPNDVVVLFSTSGGATNLVRALDAATHAGATVVCLLGRDGGLLAGRANAELIVEGTETERIQEAHQVVLHVILDAVEQAFPAND